MLFNEVKYSKMNFKLMNNKIFYSENNMNKDVLFSFDENNLEMH